MSIRNQEKGLIGCKRQSAGNQLSMVQIQNMNL